MEKKQNPIEPIKNSNPDYKLLKTELTNFTQDMTLPMSTVNAILTVIRDLDKRILKLQRDGKI